MKQVDHTEWELLKRTAAAHLESPFWHSGAFCITPASSSSYTARRGM